MAITKKDPKNTENKKKTAATIGKKPSTTNKGGAPHPTPPPVKGAKKLVNKMAHTVENLLTDQGENTGGSGKESGTNRFRALDSKTIAETIGLLAEEIKLYMEENEEIGVSKLLGVMKSRDKSDAMTFTAMGWLIRDGKIVISSDGKKISLK